jgi:riboflavin kinase / FMN adenylyltransferase
MWKGASVRVVVIGVFDGVHRGHQALVNHAVARAHADPTDPGVDRGSEEVEEVIVVTFDPHPASVLRPDRAPKMLTNLDRRRELLAQAGADEVAVLTFDEEFAKLSPEEFVDHLRDEVLRGRHIDVIVAGANFRFGAGAVADAEALRVMGQRADVEGHGFDVDVVELITEETAEGARVPWSSTFVRARVAEGDVAAARRVLGRPHRLEGVVVGGEKRGRELGYPTANVDVPDGMAVPADGVYAGWLIDGEVRWPAAISVGTNPPFEGRRRTVEAFVLDRDDLDLCDHEVSVEFAARIRGQEVFVSVQDLVARMGVDVAEAARIIAADQG